MKRGSIAVLLACACLGGCFDGAGDDAEPSPPPNQPTTRSFNAFAAELATSTNSNAADPVDLATITFTFDNENEAAFASLFP